MAGDVYEIYAIKYGDHPERKAQENFLFGDKSHDFMPIDYFVWVITNNERTIMVDTGFSKETAELRGRNFLRCPAESLKLINVNPDRLTDIVITHLHYDHAGNPDLFPHARYHIQDREMSYATGRCMCHASMRHAFAVDDVTSMVQKVYAGRVQFHDGTSQLAPGIMLHHVGGHTSGLQVLRVNTNRGQVVVASDASHMYANMEQGRPFPIIYNLGDMLEGHQTCYRLASSSDHVIPGHDPLVLKKYPAPSAALEGIVARLDVSPTL
jgi:glyoxylase-like metal-dependent hydrolase (beta-lactamase superfamily II)